MPPPAFRRRVDPAKVLLHAGLLLCGVALTWACAAIGLFLLTASDCTGSKAIRARAQVSEIEQAITMKQLDHPSPRAVSMTDRTAAGPRWVDPWGREIVYRWSPDGLQVVSAGPDRRFGTADDLTTN